MSSSPDNIAKAIRIYEKSRIERATKIRTVGVDNLKTFKLMQKQNLTRLFQMYFKYYMTTKVLDRMVDPILSYDDPSEPLSPPKSDDESSTNDVPADTPAAEQKIVD